MSALVGITGANLAPRCPGRRSLRVHARQMRTVRERCGIEALNLEVLTNRQRLCWQPPCIRQDWCALLRKSPEQAPRRARGFVNEVGMLAIPLVLLALSASRLSTRSVASGSCSKWGPVQL